MVEENSYQMRADLTYSMDNPEPFRGPQTSSGRVSSEAEKPQPADERRLMEGQLEANRTGKAQTVKVGAYHLVIHPTVI